MSELMVFDNAKITSPEIAELAGKRHDNVKRAIIKYGIKHDIKHEYYENNPGLKKQERDFYC